MSKGNTFETDILALIFNATAIADLAENDATSPATNLSVALHTADPGEAGTQATRETAYTGYARVNVARTSGGWTVAAGSVSPVANIDFGECTAAPGAAMLILTAPAMTGGAATVVQLNVVSSAIPAKALPARSSSRVAPTRTAYSVL